MSLANDFLVVCVGLDVQPARQVVEGHRQPAVATSHLASLNYFLASHILHQMNNGFTHQDHGFIDHVMNIMASVVRV